MPTHASIAQIDFRANTQQVSPQMVKGVQAATHRFLGNRAKLVSELAIWEDLRQAASDLRLHTLDHLDHYLEQLESQVIAAGGEVHWARDAADARDIVVQIAREHNAKSGSLAYDTSKAAADHLVRELAIELAPLVRVNGLAPATVVEGSSMFPRERVITSLTKYSVAFDQSESTDSLREKLARFYAQRTLTKMPITLADQAEMAWLLISNKFSKTTGQIISVDGGLHEAFLR